MRFFVLISSLILFCQPGQAKNIYALHAKGINWNDVNLKKESRKDRSQTEADALCLACIENEMKAMKALDSGSFTTLSEALNFDVLSQQGVKLGPQSVVLNLGNEGLIMVDKGPLIKQNPTLLAQIREKIRADTTAQGPAPLWVKPRETKVRTDGEIYTAHGKINYVWLKTNGPNSSLFEIDLGPQRGGRVRIRATIPVPGL